MQISRIAIGILLISGTCLAAKSKTFAPATSQPGDEMMHKYLGARAEQLDAGFLAVIESAEEWQKVRGRLKEEFFYMLGLSPMPEKTPLQATVTRTLDRGDYVVDMLHYQSRPGLYVTANLYRPARAKNGEKLPGVLYVCGHSNKGRDGNKTAYQPFGIWFARHGYVCLTVDSLQLGEIASIHHGTYREKRFWWHSRGYTPAGVECWNGIRGIDYLVSRPDVDPERIAVTGISGGGAATYWIAAADERAKVAVPVSGMSDLQAYVGGCLVDGHCDCMFMYNAFRWPWTQIAALIAPRPMLFVNSDADPIFPLVPDERIANRLERFYRLFGAGDMFDAMVSIGGHAYRKDIRQATYRFTNTHLKNDPRVVTDSEQDVPFDDDKADYAIKLSDLRVFPTDADVPKDQLNTRIDETFVPAAKVELPREGEFEAWKARLLAEVRRVSFGAIPAEATAPEGSETLKPGTIKLTSEAGISVVLEVKTPIPDKPRRVFVEVANEAAHLGGLRVSPDDVLVVCHPRGIRETRWTHTNPPNTVERSLPLLGSTADTGRVWDVIATARYLNERLKPSDGIDVRGDGQSAIIAAYAALLEPCITSAFVLRPPTSHMDADAPQFLNILRVCDVPEMLGMLAPRPLQIGGADPEMAERVRAIYKAADAGDKLHIDK